MVNKKFVSKVDEKLKAAEARRAELERTKAAEQDKKLAMRRERWNNATGNNINKKVCNENAKQQQPHQQHQQVEPINVKLFKYLRFPDGKVIKLDWENQKRSKKRMEIKLFSIKCVENLIQREEFDMAEVILGIMKKSIEARHPIQNKFAQLHGRIVEVKERNKRIFTAASALNFTGSISPVRVPDFEADLNQLSRLSSPIGMKEIAEKYSNIEELHMKSQAQAQLQAQMQRQVSVSKTTVTNESLEDQMYHMPFDYNDGPDSPIEFTDSFEASKCAVKVPKTPTKKSVEVQSDQTNFPTVISPMKRPQKDIEAEVVYTPQRKSARRLNDDEIIYDEENVSQILLNDPNAAFITNPYITLSPVKKNSNNTNNPKK